jgi:hypothetical protein
MYLRGTIRAFRKEPARVDSSWNWCSLKYNGRLDEEMKCTVVHGRQKPIAYFHNVISWRWFPPHLGNVRSTQKRLKKTYIYLLI